ncbi:MAG TPA: NAD(P)/FAD-dependent oxidoreductase [Actinoplanes sp.]|nr:NAD(P)/FAD-dependent oxidoreductase [Actinoplanes sp.]
MTYDVVVIGGGPAGLSGAVALGRALRSVAVIDAGEPRNAPAEGIHNYLTRDHVPPAEFAGYGRAEVTRYGGSIVEGAVASVTHGPPFAVTLTDGTVLAARRLLVASGAIDVLPDIPGLQPLWGSKVLHCPYCHGYEVRGEPIGIIATTERAVHTALLWRQWTPDLTLFRNNVLLPGEDFTGRGITVVDGTVTAVDETGVTVDGDRQVPRTYLVVQTRLEARADFLAPLGLKPVEHPMGIGTHIPAEDLSGRTSVPGVWVAGNVTDPMAQVITSAASGMAAGAMINMDLITGS